MKSIITRAATRTETKQATGTETDKVAITIMAVASGLVGAWVVACLAVAVVASGGPVALVGSWLKAITG